MLSLAAVDLGASSGRVMHAGFSGESLRLDEVHRFSNAPLHKAAGLYWNFPAILDEVRAGVVKAAQVYGKMASLAIDSWAVDYGLVDRKGQLIDLPRHYRDRRNLAAMSEALVHIDVKTLFGRTGIQQQPFNTIFQLYGMLHDGSECVSHADTLLLIPDLLNFFLTGVQASEFTNATTTQLLHAETGQWDNVIASSLGLPLRMLPPVVSPGTVAGPLTDEELRQNGALADTRVVHTASHDTASAVVSVPSQSGPYAYISSGTWSLMGTVVRNPCLTETAFAYNFTNEGGVGNYRLLKNIMGLWIVQEIQRDVAAEGEPSDIERLVHGARMAQAFPFLFDPDDPRLLQPDSMPAMLCQICHETGQPVPDNPGALVRGVFESLALQYRAVLEQLEEVTGEHYDTVHVVGGGSRNELLCQFTANATGRPVVAGPVEASAFGNVLVQLMALGHVTSQAEIKELVARSFEPVTYIPRDQEMWQGAYHRFQRMAIRQAEYRGE